MNANNAAIGASKGISLLKARAEKEQSLQQQQEKHNASMVNKSQVSQQNDLKLQQMEQKIAEADKKIFINDFDGAMKPLIKSGDPTLLQNMKGGEKFKALFGDVADIQTLDKADVSGVQDQALIAAGIPESDIAKMTPEDKEKIIKAHGHDLLLFIGADGTKTVQSVDHIAGMSGYTSRLDQSKRKEYTAAITAGGIRRAMALAEYNGDDKLVAKLQESYKTLESMKSKSTGSTKESVFVQKAKYAVMNEGGDPNDEAAVAKKVVEQSQPSAIKTANAKVEAMSEGMHAVPDIQHAKSYSELQIVLNTPSVVKARMYEQEQINKNKKFKDPIDSYFGAIQSIKSFGNVVNSIKDGKIEANALSKVTDMVKSTQNNKTDSAFWSKNPGMKDVFNTDASDFSKRTSSNQMLQLATVALIKSMSGLAVTNEEREMYMKMVGLGATQSTTKVLIAAQTFINSQMDSLSTFTDMISAEYPVTGAMLKQETKFATSNIARRNGKAVSADPKAEAEAAKAHKQKQLDTMNSLIKGLD